MILGVTGGIASGKSTVTRMLESLGAAVVSADELAREVVRPGAEPLQELVRRFGRDILLPDGNLDRQALGKRIFADPEARNDLNRILHPAIGELSRKRLREAAARNRLVVYEVPLLFEVGAEGRVDAVLVVTVSEDLQRRRLEERDGLSPEEVDARIASQLPQEEKVARADFVVDNSGSLEQTKAQVNEIFARLMTES